MIGFFKCDAKPNVKNSLVLAHSSLNDNIQGYFYFRESDCSDVSSIDKGSEFFGVLDDASGFGACLFVKDLEVESQAALMQNNLHIKGDIIVDGDEKIHGSTTIDGNETITGNLDVVGNIKTNAMITGNSPNTTITLNSAQTALIVAMGLTASPATLTPVIVNMNNS